MRDWKGSRRAAAVALTLALFTLGATREADAHPARTRRRPRRLLRLGSRGTGSGSAGDRIGAGVPGPYYGYGYPVGGPDMNYAMMSGMGAVELNVKPNRADVWVDGRYVAEARDLDGYPTYLWLADGGHHLQVYKGGFKLFDDQIDVRRGMRSEIKIKLEPGESQPPGLKPGEKSSGEKPSGDKPKDDKPKDDKPQGDQERSER